MTRRVDRIAANVLPDRARVAAGALSWSGTFHAVGARLLREYAEQIGLDRAFTIHDREDSADLMNLVRHDLGLSKTEERFPAKNTCLAIYSRTVNAEAALDEVLESSFPWCVGWEDESSDCAFWDRRTGADLVLAPFVGHGLEHDLIHDLATAAGTRWFRVDRGRLAHVTTARSRKNASFPIRSVP